MNDRILGAAGEAYHFITDAGDDRHEQHAGSDALDEIRPAQEGKDKNRHDHDDEQEIRTAPRMEAAMSFDVLDGQFLSRFIRPDGLVFGPMVFKNAADVRRQGNPPYI